jgi:hydrogenase maturation protease
MNEALVDQIVSAVLYEGYILYPYRPSVKNRQRWTFGGLYPRAFCQVHAAGDTSFMQTECLVHGNENTVVDVQARFLHLQARQVGKLERRLAEMPGGEEPPCKWVEKLKVGDRLLQAWQEAVQREMVLPSLNLASIADAPQSRDFVFVANRTIEPVRGHTGAIEAMVVRRQQSVAARVQLSVEPIRDRLFKLSVRIENQTPFSQPDQTCREQAVLQALASTHTILCVRNGEFISLIDPPDEYRALADACQNVGTWPVLVGQEGESDAMLSSPITLYDYPQIAVQSPGDFFDSTEIDEMLVLRIMTLTEEESLAAAAVDAHARALLDRTRSLTTEQMIGLHGTFRGLRPVPAGERR